MGQWTIQVATKSRTLHFALYTLHSALYTLHSTLCTLHFNTPHTTLYTLHSTLQTPHFTLHTFHSFTLYTLHFTLHTLQLQGSRLPLACCTERTLDTILLLNMHLDRMHNKKLQLASSQQVRAKPNQCHETGSPFIVPVAVMRLIQDALMERALNNFARKQGWKGRPKDPTNGATQSEWAAGVPKSVNPRHQAKVHGDWLPLAPA